MAQVTIVTEKGDAFTHGGIFHADEVMATAMLSIAFPELRVQRGFRVTEGFAGVVYDIGGGEFDHHQAGGNGARENGVPYASAGLIWRAYGEQIMLDAGAQNAQAAAAAIDAKLIQGIDAVDNGITLKTEGDCQCQPYTISQMVASLNPTWDSEESSDAAFVKAVELAATTLQAAISSEVSKQKAASLVQDALREMEERGDNILSFDRFVPFTETVASDPAYDRAMFAVFPSLRGGWNMQCVPPADNPMGQRLPIPEAWRQGPNPEAYRELGLEGVTFVHVNGFLASCGTREEAMAFAAKVTAESPAESR